ncbi:MAG: class I SAM-dependent methyltransferase [Planctomycetes bacterium]|nr:class I SAM-dependent methyltransferase [Planctomycetota bacterium]
MFRHIGEDPLAIQESFKGLFPKKVAEALGELRALRRRATYKFSQGLDMYFTRPLLEQASSESVAAYRARRFTEAGIEVVHDPCCGMGADSIALAHAGLQVHASDKDEVAVHFAEVNAKICGVDSVNWSVADASEVIPPQGAIFLDPARRRGSRRIMDPNDWSPTPDQIGKLLKGRDAACLKLSPATDFDILLELFPTPDEIEVISLKGEAKETLFWYGKLASGTERRSTCLPDEETFAGPEQAQAPTGEIGAHLYDPDPSLIRAGLLGAFAETHGLRTIDPEIAYLTGDEVIDSPFLSRMKVLGQESLDPRKMRKLLREFEVGTLHIRKRGIAERPGALEQRFLPKSLGDRTLTLVATRVGDRHIGYLTEPHA